MRPTRFVRALTAVLAAWFGLVVVEPVTAHPCPLHDGALASRAMARRRGSMEHGASSSGRAGHEHGAASHQCQCLGDCSPATTAVTVPPRVAVTFDARVIETVVAIAAPRSSIAAVPAPHALPFANGPPATRRA